MLRMKYVVFLFFVCCSTAFAAGSKPSEQSIKELLSMTGAQRLLDTMTRQVDGMMKASAQEVLKGQEVSPEQQKVIDRTQAKMAALVKQELSWDILEPLYIRIYGDSFTQQEVDGILAFYKTPAGQAVIKKMPIVMQNSMAEMQKRMGPLAQKLQQIEKEMTAELRAQNAKQ